MKRSLLIVTVIIVAASENTWSQGWVAEVNLDFNHDRYAYENISSVTFTFSGVTVTGSSSISTLSLVLKGTGPMTGNFTLSAKGLAWEPYDRYDPYSQPISASHNGNYAMSCSQGFFQGKGSSPEEQIYIWIRIHPRLEISEFIDACDALSLKTKNSCVADHVWEIGESLSGVYKTIPGKTGASVSLMHSDLAALGFNNPYGRKYFRVTGKSGTTSQIQVIDISYPPASASIITTDPKCYDIDDGVITAYITSPSISIINDFVVTLFSDETLSTPVQQQFISDKTEVIFPGLPAGIYWLKIENNSNVSVYGNCWSVYKVKPLVEPAQISIPDIEASNYNGFGIQCHGGANGTLKAFPRGGTGTYAAYEWTGTSSTSAVAVNLSAGTYEVKVRDSNDCWSKPFSKTLVEPQHLSVSLVSSGGKNGFDVSCHDKEDGVLEAHVSGGVANYTYEWSNGNRNPVMTGVGTGTYAIKITDKNGCIAGGKTTLIAPDPIDFAIEEVAGINCAGDKTGILEIQGASNTIGEIRYTWSSGESQKEIRDKPSGTYTASVSDGQGCIATKSHTLTEPAPWSVDISALSDYNGSVIRCNGEGNGALTALVKDGNNITAVENYVWYKNGSVYQSGKQLSQIDALHAGTYRVEITYDVRCKAEDVFIVQEPSALNIQVAGVSDYNGLPVSCHGSADGSIIAKASGGTGNVYTYRWADGQTTALISNLPAGRYSVRVTDVNGCEGVAEKMLIGPERVEAVIDVASDYNGQPLSCAGASDGALSVSAKGGVPMFNFVWNTGETSDLLTNLAAGSYTVTATDANGCGVIAGTTIADPLPVDAQIVRTSNYHGYGVSCHGSQDGYLLSQATGGTGTYAYQWNSGEHTAALLENISPGHYKVVVTDMNGCSDTALGEITAPAPLSLGISETKGVSCFGGRDGEIKLLANGGAGNYEFAALHDGWQTSQTIAGLQAGTYETIVRDLNGCHESTVALITEPSRISVQFDHIEPALCGDAKGKASALITGGTGDYSYTWTDTEGTNIGHGPSISGLLSGIYSLTVRDANLCLETKSVGITSTDGPEVSVSKIISASCSYAKDGSASVEITGGVGPFDILWEDGQQSAQAVALASGDHLVRITDANNCSVVELVSVPAPDSLVIHLIEKRDPQCNGSCDGTLKVAASGGNDHYSFLWDDHEGPEAVDLCDGQYQVKVTDNKGCLASATFTLDQPAAVSVELTESQEPRCHDACDGRLAIEASGGTGALTYEWSNGAQTPVIGDVCPGFYTITVRDAHNCSATDVFSLRNPAEDILDLGGSTTLCEGQSHVLDAGPWKTYSWGSNTNFRSGDRQVTISETGLYWIEATSHQDCIVQDTFLLETSTDLLKANFLMASAASVNDTVVMIDVSWPWPEKISWHRPDQLRLLEDYGDIAMGQFGAPGQYSVSLTARLGECIDKVTKEITIHDTGDGPGDGRMWSEPFVKVLGLYPNPNEGKFEVEVEFLEASPVMLTVFNLLTSMKIAQIRDDGQSKYLKYFDLGPLSAGTYTLRLDYTGGTKFLRFVVR